MNDKNFEKLKKTLVETAFPVYVIVEIINVCNLKCIMCPQGQGLVRRKKQIIEFDLFKKIIDEMVDVSPKSKLWPAIMGEPLLAGKKLKACLNYAIKRGIDVVLNTNGTLLNDDWIDYFIHSGIEEIIIGVDAYSKSSYSHIRVGGDYDHLVAMIEKLLAKKPKDLHIVLQYIVMKENEHEVEAFKKFWLSKGAILKIRPKQGWGKHVHSESLTLGQDERSFPCPWLLRTMTILVDGIVAQCDGDVVDGRYSPGDIRKESLSAIWNGELKRRRQKHFNNNFDFPPCNECKDWQLNMSEIVYPQKYKHEKIIRDKANQEILGIDFL